MKNINKVDTGRVKRGLYPKFEQNREVEVILTGTQLSGGHDWTRRIGEVGNVRTLEYIR